MTKALTYTGLIVASSLIIMGFITAKTYPQLAAAIILYPALIFIAFNIFPRKGWKTPKITIQAPIKLNGQINQTAQHNTTPAYVADIERRAFIKLIGATGISFFLMSIFGRKIDSLFFGRTGQSVINTNPIGNNDQFGTVSASPTDGYKISEVDEGSISYYGFINNQGAWLIMREEIDGGSFRYAKGGSDFPGNWASRENLRYDYFNALF